MSSIKWLISMENKTMHVGETGTCLHVVTIAKMYMEKQVLEIEEAGVRKS